METKHTPGPWSVPHFATEHPCNCQYVLSDNQHGPGAIAFVHHQQENDGEHNEPFEVAVANAHLIAAAPELLEALVALLDDCGEAMADGYVENSIHIDEVTKARAAIAKATTPGAQS